MTGLLHRLRRTDTGGLVFLPKSGTHKSAEMGVIGIWKGIRAKETTVEAHPAYWNQVPCQEIANQIDQAFEQVSLFLFRKQGDLFTYCLSHPFSRKGRVFPLLGKGQDDSPSISWGLSFAYQILFIKDTNGIGYCRCCDSKPTGHRNDSLRGMIHLKDLEDPHLERAQRQGATFSPEKELQNLGHLFQSKEDVAF